MQKIDLHNKTVFVTGSAGFIGSNLVLELLKTQSPIHIVGLDNLNDYYDVSIKEWRLSEIDKCVAEHPESTYHFYKGDLADKAMIDQIFATHKPTIVVNLGAQAGVRYSITNPDAYIQSNMIGFYNILEACRHSYDNGETGVEHLVYASSSSVYGTNKKIPYSTDDKVDNPVSLYAATKKSNELMAHAYSKLYNIPSTGLRFFTVYGPAGRPDMAYFGFTNKLLKGQTIQIFNYGNCKRDFTYVDDIVEGVKRVMQGAPEKKNGEDGPAGASVQGLQHRQQQSGEPAGLRRHPTAGIDPCKGTPRRLRLRGPQGAGAHAARGCAYHLRRHHRSGARLRFQTQHQSPRGTETIRRMVQGIL